MCNQIEVFHQRGFILKVVTKYFIQAQQWFFSTMSSKLMTRNYLATLFATRCPWLFSTASAGMSADDI